MESNKIIQGLKIDFCEIFLEPFNWREMNKKIAEIDARTEKDKKSFQNDIFESFGYLNTVYEAIDFSNNIINIKDFIISSIIFDSLIEKIKEIEKKFNFDVLKKCDFSSIIKNNFKSDSINENQKYEINNEFIKIYIGEKSQNKESDTQNKESRNFEMEFLKGIRNKLIHPNGNVYKKTHMYSIGTHKESESELFSFGGCFLVEDEINTSPTFFIKKSIFLECIKEIANHFKKGKVESALKKYIIDKRRFTKNSLKLSNIKEAQNCYDKYFKEWEDISLLFIWFNENGTNNHVEECLKTIYSIAKLMKDINNFEDDWQSLIPDWNDDIERLMIECGKKDDYLKNKMRDSNFHEREWLGWFGKKESAIFLEMYKKVLLKEYVPKNIYEKFCFVIFDQKIDFEILSKKLSIEWNNIVEKLKN